MKKKFEIDMSLRAVFYWIQEIEKYRLKNK